jgi:hypothetical protein
MMIDTVALLPGTVRHVGTYQASAPDQLLFDDLHAAGQLW